MRLLRIVLMLPLAVAAGLAQPIVIDHTSTDITRIPDAWLERARALVVHYAYTSHGSQIVSGLDALAAENPKYGYRRYTGQPRSLPASTGVPRLFLGQPDGVTYITPELYWSESGGLAATRNVAATGLFQYSMWAWCGQQSTNSAATVQSYLNTLDQLDAAYPSMRFILMTGHTDGGSATLARNNDAVRTWARTHGKVLFDFADIESWDPAGKQYPSTSDACDWCTDWCKAHPEDCRKLTTDCAHSHGFNCKLKAQAFWWMAARLAGWSGPGAVPSIAAGGVVSAASFAGGAVAPGQIVTVFGEELGPPELVTGRPNADGVYESTLGGTRVLFDGVAAPLLYAVRGQVSAIAPYRIAQLRSTNVSVEYQGRAGAPVQVRTVAAAPALFTADASGRGQGAILNENYSENSARNPAARQSVVMLYATGEGLTSPGGVDGKVAGLPLPRPVADIAVTIGGVEAEVLYAGAAQGLVSGLMQVNVRIPAGAPVGPAVAVRIRAGAAESPSGVTMAIQ